MKKILSILTLVLALNLCLGLTALADTNAVYQLGDKIDDFTITTYDGKTVTLSEVLKEKEAVLINIWATWCGPCRNEFPFMEEAYKQYSDKVEVIALSCEPGDTDKVLADFAASLGLTFPMGQDTAGLSQRFAASSIPTSIMVDRFGTICFRASGTIPDTASFARLFDAFLGDAYTDSMLLSRIPTHKPDVLPSTTEELNAALNVEGGDLTFTNSAYVYHWPMVTGKVEDRSVAVSSNAGMDDTQARVNTVINAKAGDAVAVTFKISSAAAMDVMQLIVSGEVVKSFGGEDDWMTYAYAFPKDGEYSVSVAYANTAMPSAGEDTLWLDSIAHLTGEDAKAALAANPTLPLANENYIEVLNENARRVIINDPTGMISRYYSGNFYIIPDEVATFELGLTEEYDPELALVAFNFDGSTYSLADCVVDGRYVAFSGVDSVETTGYCDSTVYLYPSLTDTSAVQLLTYFRNEENLDLLVSQMTADASGVPLGSWTYADGSLPGVKVEVPSESTYVVKYVDQNGDPVPGVMCQVCNETICQVYVSDENGVCQFILDPYAWEIHTLMVPQGYTGDTQTVTLAPVEGGEMVFTLTKN